jgi:hypothetical protein
MRTYLANALETLVRLLRPKAVPSALRGGQWTGTSFTDAYKRERQPTPNELLAELKNTAWACASINAAVCASHPPLLYVATHDGQPEPKCLTKALAAPAEHALRANPRLAVKVRHAPRLAQVLDHPLLSLLQQVNPVHNSFDLWELTTLYQEVHGCAYWYLDIGPLGVPTAIWVLPAQNVTPVRLPDSPNLVDATTPSTRGCSAATRS